ncbi:MAG TPA: MBL fold metallo-hydrolase [Thermomicrobiales bacterium]|nr:MBL fold metallo-hydrolase [Thermomicrobiales bacterium]
MAEIKWFGHDCFRVRGREATILMDPVGKTTGYALPKQKADIVTVSHPHPGHNALGQVQDGYFLIDGPGEYEVSDVFIKGIRTFHDNERGQRHGFNTIYVLELEDLRICHLGDLGHTLTEEQAELLDDVDVLMVPVGGGNALDSVGANEVIGQIEPRIVIPMHFQTAAGDTTSDRVERFCKELGIENLASQEKLTVRKGDLPDNVKVVILEP